MPTLLGTPRVAPTSQGNVRLNEARCWAETKCFGGGFLSQTRKIYYQVGGSYWFKAIE